ncbi:MAG: hypothetical protein RL333_410 [Pseudomonadota bacterium]|jgi:Ser/Thr protein kinase RdoA (MazF antagonist)
MRLQATDPHPFESLTPDLIGDALESAGWAPDGRIMALNSYENRVFQVGLETGGFAIAKFYRPGRWSDSAILEEHQYLKELKEAEIPVAPMLENREGESLFFYADFRFALSPRVGGRPPETEDLDQLESLGRLIARIHAIGKLHPFHHRPTIDPSSYGHRPGQRLLEGGLIPSNLLNGYQEALEAALVAIDAAFEGSGAVSSIRLHADAYPGNILATADGPLLLDFDDARMGPRVQDLWMLAQGDDAARRMALMTLIEGYDLFESFDPRELRLIEPLRTLRLIHYTDWLSARTQDPAFPKAFPDFGTPAYWTERTHELLNQVERMAEPFESLLP